MKISYRILLINFAVVVAILASSALVIYSVMYNIVSSQQSRYLVNSARFFSEDILNSLSKRTGAEIALIHKGAAVEVSNSVANNEFYDAIARCTRD
jgi:hypothetical protein